MIFGFILGILGLLLFSFKVVPNSDYIGIIILISIIYGITFSLACLAFKNFRHFCIGYILTVITIDYLVIIIH